MNKKMINFYKVFIFFSLFVKEISNWATRHKACVCDFTNKLSNTPTEKTTITCKVNPNYGDEVKIIGNANYVFECFKNSKIYCPYTNSFTKNADIKTYSTGLDYKISKETVNGKELSIYKLTIDKNASDLLFLCVIKPELYSEYLSAVVTIDLKKETVEEYSKEIPGDPNLCNFISGNLNINPTNGNYKNSRNVNCIHNVIPEKPLNIHIPLIKGITDKFLPTLVNCISEYSFVHFNIKYVQERLNYMEINIIFGNIGKNFNLTCSFDLSDYHVSPCAIGRKGNVIFVFNHGQDIHVKKKQTEAT